MSTYILTFDAKVQKRALTHGVRIRGSFFRSFLDFPPAPCYNMRASRCVGIGRRGGLKILWANNPCGFDPRHRHQQKRAPRMGRPLLLVPTPFGVDPPNLHRGAVHIPSSRHPIKSPFLLFRARTAGSTALAPCVDPRHRLRRYLNSRPTRSRIVEQGARHSRTSRSPCFVLHRFAKTPHRGVFAR